MSRKNVDDVRSRTSTMPIPRESLRQTAAFWDAKWEDSRKVIATVEVDDEEPFLGRTPTHRIEVIR